MGTVQVYTAARMKAIEDSAIVSGTVTGENLILTKYDGSFINAGKVKGADGSPGAPGVDGSSAFLPVAISTTVDLNNYKSSGNFVPTSDAVASSSSNFPKPLVGILEVLSNPGQTVVWQQYSIAKTGNILDNTQWLRTFKDGTWSAWRGVASPTAYGLARLNANVSLANATWTTVTAWTDEEKVGLTYASGVWTTQVAGIYNIHFTISFANNATGIRGIRPYINGTASLNVLSNPTSGFQTTMDVSIRVRLAVNATIACQAYQSSTANLNMLGDASGMYSKVDLNKSSD